MANRRYNTQVTNSRQPLARGGSAKKPKRKPSPKKLGRGMLGGTGPTRPTPIKPIIIEVDLDKMKHLKK